ncbi:MAG TPA: glycosyltransferase [Methylovirgula sp.]|nr:glycosyltransferase [Methylovirgula sp.]
MATFRTFFHGPLTGYEITCLKSFKDHGHRVIVHSYDPRSIPDLFEAADAQEILPREELFCYQDGPGKGSVAAFANIFRYALCATFGDWWIDCDVLCLSPDWPEDFAQIIAGWERSDSICNAVLRLDKGLAATLENRAKVLGKEVKWGEAGPVLLTELVKQERKESEILAQSAFYAIPIDHWHWFYSDDRCNDVLLETRDSLAAHLWHEYGRQNGFDKSVLPSKDSFFGHIVAKHDTARFFRSEAQAKPERSMTPTIPMGAARKLPLLSFVIVNYNYGRFLRACVESIMTQTYSNIECVVVDNASTDNSMSVLEDLTRRYPPLKLLRNEENIGQTAACAAGFALTRGSYVAFIDADDFLLPNFAATHIRTHLILPYGVGFTSADMLEMVGDAIVLGHPSYLGKEKCKPIDPGSLRQVRDISAALATDELESGELDAKLRKVAKSNIHWVWSPTSGTVYRRDAVSLFVNNPRLRNLRFAADCYFNYPINALSGSVLIEKPLAVYRIHDSNNFTERASLGGMAGYKKEVEEGRRAAFFALEHMVVEFDSFFARSQDFLDLWGAMRTLRRKSGTFKWEFGERALSFVMKGYFQGAVRYLGRRYGLRSDRR